MGLLYPAIRDHMSSSGWTGKEKGFAYGPPMLRKWDGGQGGGGGRSRAPQVKV